MEREGRRPAPWGRGRSGWAAAHGCASQQPGCDPPPRLDFAARERCGQSRGVLSRTSILGEDAQRERVRRGGAGRRTASWQRHVRQQDAYRVFPATRMRWRRAPRDCGDAHTECCVRVWCWIERPRGRNWVCVWHGAGSRGGSGGAGENELRVGDKNNTQHNPCMHRTHFL